MYSTGVYVQEMLVLYGRAMLGFTARKNENANVVLKQQILYITLPTLILYSFVKKLVISSFLVI
ncbi:MULTISPECIES: hypothetical protein [Metabacillus]|jgi:malate permease and related proteins|uniref:Uncharacterized protein n=1 Tax=Metabacillus rhizolycopersici TaxID=2875709 RepID=A0ABS7UPC7_9BACI|nr:MULTISPECIES: hypothetical protein [Metabacillus]MBZ5749952.1 hypothetical protein [Metabacillus rhizolycopersici]MCM3654583.1 hypothetical protein [Metabacillus litoralis]